MELHGDLTGRTLGQYEVIERIGQGGMGIVYRARDAVLERDVALKVLPAGFARNDQYLQRFMREAKSVARLDHPNIVAVYGAGEEDGIYFIVMFYVKGHLLQDLIDRAGRLSVYQSIQVTKQVADALAEAHANNIVHRDIKPQNVMIGRNSIVKVMDFGLARLVQSTSGLTATGAMLGTPKYMSPEQCEGHEVDCKTDIFSLGVTLYEMLTGKLPYDADSDMGIMYQIVHKPFPSLSQSRNDVPEAVSDLLDFMVVKDPGQRTITADNVSRRCDAILRNLDAEALPETPPGAEGDAEKKRKRLSDLETVAATPVPQDGEANASSAGSAAAPMTPAPLAGQATGPWGEPRPVTPSATGRTPHPVESETAPESATPAPRNPTPFPKSKGDPFGGTRSVVQSAPPTVDWAAPLKVGFNIAASILKSAIFIAMIALVLFLVWVGFGHAGLYPLPDGIRTYLEGNSAPAP